MGIDCATAGRSWKNPSSRASNLETWYTNFRLVTAALHARGREKEVSRLLISAHRELSPHFCQFLVRHAAQLHWQPTD